MKKIKLKLTAITITVFVIATSCKDKTGVCTACCSNLGTAYCKDGWTESECKDWSNQKVNGLSWSWHEGQTCAGRGTPATP